MQWIGWGGLIVAILAWAASERQSESETQSPSGGQAKPQWFMGLLLTAGICAAAILAALKFSDTSKDWMPLAIAAASGAVGAFLMGVLCPNLKPSAAASAVPMGLGGFVSAMFVQKLGGDSAQVCLSLTLGASLSSLGMAAAVGSRKGQVGFEFALALGGASLLNALGAFNGEQKVLHSWHLAGSILVIGAALLALLVGGIFRGMKMQKPWLEACLVAVLLAGATFFLGGNIFMESQLLYLLLFGLGAALVVSWLLPENAQSGTFSFVLASAIWVSIATVSFGFLRGFGMGTVLLAAVIGFTLFGSRKGLVTLGPLFALTLYRLFREMFTDATQALDIGQHYAILGILIGMLLVLGPIEWARSRALRDALNTVSVALVEVAILLACITGAILLGAKGSVGLGIGFGIGAVAAGLRNEKSPAVILQGLALSSVLILSFDPLSGLMDLDRDQKVRLLIELIGGVATLIIVARVLSAPKVEKEVTA